MRRPPCLPACADPVQIAIGDLFQPFSPTYLESPARAFYLRSQAEAPVSYSRTFNAWMCTGHAEVTAVLRSPQVFSSTKILDLPPQPPKVYEVLSRAVAPLPPGLFNNDPPGHPRARALFSSALSPARVASLEPTIRSSVADLIQGLSERGGTVDLMSTFAFPLLLRMSATLAGIPVSDAPMLKAWQEDWFRLYGTDLSVDQRVEAARGVVAHHTYLRELVRDRRRSPADDFITALIHARHGEERPFSEDEIVSHLIILFVAGYETAAALIGSMVLHLLCEPELWEAVGQDHALLCAAMEETLRVDGPVQMEPRHTTTEAVVGGVRIPAGATVFPFFGAASYDTNVFPDPLRFDPARREVSRHFGFGHGIHTCIGGPLARQEVSIAVGALRRAFPRLRLAHGARPAFQPSLFFRTLLELPVALGEANG
jgi:cytochrome P450